MLLKFVSALQILGQKTRKAVLSPLQWVAGADPILLRLRFLSVCPSLASLPLQSGIPRIHGFLDENACSSNPWKLPK